MLRGIPPVDALHLSDGCVTGWRAAGAGFGGTEDFTVSPSSAYVLPVTVNCATADGTAVAGTDYTATSGTPTFAPGTTSQAVTVPVLGETTTATSKTLGLDLSAASGTTNPTATALGTISYEVSGASSVLSNDLAETSGGSEAVAGTTVAAASFKTDSSAYSLADVQLLLQAANTASKAAIAISTDGDLRPGTLVGTLTSPTSYTTESLGDSAFTSAGIALAANTTYRVVLSAPTGSFH